MDKHEGLTKEELERTAVACANGQQIEDLSSSEIVRIMTIGQYLADRGLAEIEKRGELELRDGMPCVPYASDHVVETILTRA